MGEDKRQLKMVHVGHRIGVNQGRLVAKINGKAASENFGLCFNKQTIKKESLHKLEKL